MSSHNISVRSQYICCLVDCSLSSFFYFSRFRSSHSPSLRLHYHGPGIRLDFLPCRRYTRSYVLRSRASIFQVAPCLCRSWPLAPSFGGIHCVGWDSPFPTSTERKLWHVPSLAVTTIPIDLILIALVITLIVKFLNAIVKSSPDADASLVALIFIISTFAYASARLDLPWVLLT